jgi:hypothetical protein
MKLGTNQNKSLLWESDQEVTWIEVYKGEDSILGISSSNEWVLCDRDRIFILKKGELNLALAPYLKKDLKEFYTSLKQALIDRELSPDLIADYPFEETLLTAFKMGLGFWISLALAWIEQLPVSIAERFIPYIEELTRRKNYRKKAGSLLKKINKARLQTS